MTTFPGPVTPSVSWTARVPRSLADQVEAAMLVLGLTTRTEAVVAALRLLRRQARETAVLAAVDTEYGPDGTVPVGPVTAGIDAMLSADDATGETPEGRRTADR